MIAAVNWTTLLLLHAAATWFMVGLIWFVQVVHYPLFAAVGAEAFGPYHRAHTRRTTLVVLPPMLLELGSAVALVLQLPDAGPRVVVWLGLALVIVIWISTFAVQVPLHERLARGGDARLVRLLVLTNGLRTAAWSLRGLLALWLLW